MDGRRSRPHRAPAGALEGVTMQLYLDCDGVLADFDRGATELLGMPPRAYEKRHGIAAFWRELARHPDFYGTLPLMPDAKELFAAVRHLIPVIQIGRAHVCTPVTNAHLVCRLLLVKKNHKSAYGISYLA